MEKLFRSQQIAKILSGIWEIHCTQTFLDHLKNTFGYQESKNIRFDCIYIAEAIDGNALDGIIGGMIGQWWKVDANGLQEITNPDLPRFPNEPENLRSDFYITPVLKFFCDNTNITFGEAFGPNLRCRKIGTLDESDGTLTITNIQIKWTTCDM